ncbi:hypothetical protein C0995_009954 [Termitomyces sp. Mi166|nr:hypothetical protein C0995_009954 [Termitomyces sp. Mi166\
MREYGPAPGELYANNPYANPYVGAGAGAGAGAGGAAGVGVARARSTRDPGAFASGFQDGATPYPAFAGPAAFQSGAYGNVGHGSSGNGNGNAGGGGGYDALVDAAGVGVQRGMSLNHHMGMLDYDQQQQQQQQSLYPSHQQQQSESDLARNTSQATTSHASSTLVGSPPLPKEKEQPPYAAHYAPGPVQETGDHEGAYGGYTDEAQTQKHGDRDRESYYDDDEDDDEDGRPPRVLKVRFMISISVLTEGSAALEKSDRSLA